MAEFNNIFLAPGALITGDVILSPGVNLWFGSIVRGDVGQVVLSENVNLQDGVIVHCDFDIPNILEPGVVAGHAAVIHGMRVGADTLVGIGARLLTESDIGPESMIAAGSVVPPGMKVPPRSVVMGIPGRVVRQARPEEIAHTRTINARYRELAKRYAAGEFRCLPSGGML